jgi:ribosomal protein L34
MYPDAHLYLHRAEQAARERMHLRHPPSTSRGWLARLRDMTGRGVAKARRPRGRAALNPR